LSSLDISLVTLAVVFGGALLGIALRAVLPENQLNAESREVVKLGVGLIATMAALVLGLLIASAKSSFDMQNAELTDMSSKVVLLDRILAHYGPDAKEARDVLRRSVVGALDSLSTENIAVPSQSLVPQWRSSVRQNPGTIAEGRCAAFDAGTSVEHHGGRGANAMVARCTKG